MKNFINGMRNQLSLEWSSGGGWVGGALSRVEEWVNAFKVSFGKPEAKRLLQIRRLE